MRLLCGRIHKYAPTARRMRMKKISPDAELVFFAVAARKKTCNVAMALFIWKGM